MSLNLKHCTKLVQIFFVHVLLLSICSSEVNAAAENLEWEVLRPVGGHFSVRLPEQVTRTDLPPIDGIELRLWDLKSSGIRYQIIAMYSEKGDFSSVHDESQKMTPIEINGSKFSQIVDQMTKNGLTRVRRRMFHASTHHAVEFAEIAPEAPKADDEFFSSIHLVEEKNSVPMKQLSDAKSGLSVLLPANYTRELNMWKGSDEDHKYIAEASPVSNLSKEEQEQELEVFATMAKGRTDEKKIKIQGLDAREFSIRNDKFLMIASPNWCYSFSCESGNTGTKTLKERDDFFNSIVIKPGTAK